MIWEILYYCIIDKAEDVWEDIKDTADDAGDFIDDLRDDFSDWVDDAQDQLEDWFVSISITSYHTYLLAVLKHKNCHLNPKHLRFLG